MGVIVGRRSLDFSSTSCGAYRQAVAPGVLVDVARLCSVCN